MGDPPWIQAASPNRVTTPVSGLRPVSKPRAKVFSFQMFDRSVGYLQNVQKAFRETGTFGPHLTSLGSASKASVIVTALGTLDPSGGLGAESSIGVEVTVMSTSIWPRRTPAEVQSRPRSSRVPLVILELFVGLGGIFMAWIGAQWALSRTGCGCSPRCSSAARSSRRLPGGRSCALSAAS